MRKTIWFQWGHKTDVNHVVIREKKKNEHSDHKKVDDYVVELAMQYTDGYSENIYSFANNVNS